jgi:DNA-binding PadR family transcriptional regulator
MPPRAGTTDRTTSASPLTELESCALALIQRLQPCSAYQVRLVFGRSPTTEWSASAGSIYPVIRRLMGLGLVKARKVANHGQRRRDLTVTAVGGQAVRGWIATLAPWTARATWDPIRTRVYFLDSLPSERERTDFLARAEELTRTMIRELRSFEAVERDTSEPDYLATLAARFQLEARLKWLRRVRERGRRRAPASPRRPSRARPRRAQ